MTMTAEAIARLPDLCWGVHPYGDRLVILKRLEVGYWPAEDYTLAPDSGLTWDDYADNLNARLGVTPAQRAAMEAGSMFGFGSPGTDPANYDEAGRYIRPAVAQ